MLSQDVAANVCTKSSSFSVASTAPSVLKTRGAQQPRDLVVGTEEGALPVATLRRRHPAGQAATPGETPSKCVARSYCRECSGCYLVRVGADALSMAANSSSLSSSVRAREFCRT
jgi:hypothetical protein